RTLVVADVLPQALDDLAVVRPPFALRYTPARQRAIQDARKAEGWTYNGEIIQGLGKDVRYVQGPDYLEKVLSLNGGEVLVYSAHRAGDNLWFLDREDFVIDGQKYTSRYTFDGNGRIAQQQVDYQNAAACNHLITMVADYGYQNDVLTTVRIHAGYDGTVVEG